MTCRVANASFVEPAAPFSNAANVAGVSVIPDTGKEPAGGAGPGVGGAGAGGAGAGVGAGPGGVGKYPAFLNGSVQTPLPWNLQHSLMHVTPKTHFLHGPVVLQQRYPVSGVSTGAGLLLMIISLIMSMISSEDAFERSTTTSLLLKRRRLRNVPGLLRTVVVVSSNTQIVMTKNNFIVVKMKASWRCCYYSFSVFVLFDEKIFLLFISPFS